MKKYITILALVGAIFVSGCHCQKKEKIQFAFDSYQLTIDDKSELDKIAKTMNNNKSLTAKIYGHADAIGASDYNMGLSRERAISAASYLEARGVSADRIRIIAFGDSDPIASNRTPQGRQENRRVVIQISN